VRDMEIYSSRPGQNLQNRPEETRQTRGVGLFVCLVFGGREQTRCCRLSFGGLYRAGYTLSDCLYTFTRHALAQHNMKRHHTIQTNTK
jgi:hypothetical protein